MNAFKLVRVIVLIITSATVVALTGCQSDPHDTHTQTSIAAPR